MKKAISIMLVFLLAFSFVACSKSQQSTAQSTTKADQSQVSTTVQTTQNKSETTTKATTEKSSESTDNSDSKKISMNINGKEVIISLDDTPAANSLYDMLPMDVNFKNFNSKEKMPSIEELLESADKPDAPSFDIGDFGLSKNDGSLSVLTNSGNPASSFNKLGTIESGLDTIIKQKGDFSATIDKVEQ